MSYQSPFAAYLEERDLRSGNSPEHQANEKSEAAINAFENFVAASASLDGEVEFGLVRNAVDSFRKKKDVGAAVSALNAIGLWMHGRSINELAPGVSTQLRDGFLALIDLASLRRSSDLTSALKASSNIFK